jgi:nicotinamidase/pyrazinamidase
VPEALVIVDFQRDFTSGGALPVPGGDEIADRIAELLDSGRFDLVIATRDWHPPNHRSFATVSPEGRWPPHCVAGTPGAELHPALDRSRVDVVIDAGTEPDAEGYSAFENPDMERVLREHGIDRLTVVGLATDYCVRATSLDALRAGFEVEIDLAGVRGIEAEPGDVERALREIVEHGGRLVGDGGAPSSRSAAGDARDRAGDAGREEGG